MYLLYDHNNKIIGRGRGTEDNCVKVDVDDLNRIISDITAFIYDPITDSVILDPHFEVPVQDSAEHASALLERSRELFYVPELDIDLSFVGDFGNLLNVAMISTEDIDIVGSRQGALVVHRLKGTEKQHIFKAYAKHLDLGGNI